MLSCYLAADVDQYSNIKVLLHIGCTLPVGSAEAERSFSCFRRLKTYVRSSMGEERMSSLALMNIFHNVEVDIDAVCKEFLGKHNRRLFQQSIIFE